ncbi:MAG: hypothetical protein HRF45_12770 [Fimbriimonadia bacterium]
MESLARYLTPEEAADLLREQCRELGADEVAVVKNLDFVAAPFEFYPLAPRNPGPLERVAAFAVDMDGTSTTTEPLALHALEYMVRRVTGRMSKDQWSGLDPVRDHPFVIGNSNFRHTEFLLTRYRDWVKRELVAEAFIESALWTLSNMEDRRRREDVLLNATNCGLGAMLEDDNFRAATSEPGLEGERLAQECRTMTTRFATLFRPATFSAEVSASLDVYYTRYHTILQAVERGEGERLSHELLGEGGRRLIEPMPGYGVFLALIKGLLGEEAGRLAPVLGGEDAETEIVAALGCRFAKAPAKIALVTASISYEAHAVVQEVFRVMAEEARQWDVSPETQERAVRAFSDHRAFYDGFVTASDSSEARLKPHRDLFSIALYQMGLRKDEYRYCIGLEDTEPGIIALRAAGVGCAVALPNHDTGRQDYRAAAHVLHGGLPELILRHNLLLAD